MIVYITSLLLALFFSTLAFDIKEPFKKKKKQYKIFAVLSAIPLFCVAAFRYGVGNDYFGYANYFKEIEYHQYMEYGFDLLLQIIRNFTDNYIWMFVVCSFIFFYFIFKAIYEQSINPTFSIFLLVCAPYYFEFFSGMRQMMAIAIFFYSIKYIKTRKIVPYIILNIIAGLLHTSAFIFIPVYFLYDFKLTPKKAFSIIIIATILRTIIKKYLYSLLLLTKYNNYIDTLSNNYHFGVVTLIVPLFIYIFAMLYYEKASNNLECQNKEYQFYCNLMFFQVIVVLFQDLGTYFARIGWGFGISQIILIPMAISRIRDSKQRLTITAFVCLLFIIYVWFNRFGTGNGTLLPYRWIFDV